MVTLDDCGQVAREADRMAASKDLVSQPLYHGTRADLKPGDLIVPGYRSNFGTKKKAGYVYLTKSLDAAAWGAELALGEDPGRVYSVDPTGPIMADPNLAKDGVNPTDRTVHGSPCGSRASARIGTGTPLSRSRP